MCNEIGAVGVDRFEYVESYESSKTVDSPKFGEAIFSQVNYHGSWPFAKSAIFSTVASETMQKIKDATQRCKAIVPLMSRPPGNFEAEFKVDFEWGGEDGVQGSASARGSYNDGQGNSAEAKFQQNSDGTGNASVDVKHVEDSDKN